MLTEVETCVSLLGELVTKIHRFIKMNNLYGTLYQDFSLKSVAFDKNEDFLTLLQNMQANLSQILKKQYQVDIFSDGSEELREMIHMLWSALQLILEVPVSEGCYRYAYRNDVFSDEEFYEKLLNDIRARYSIIENVIFESDCLECKTDDELFSIYNDMIEIDTLGLIGANRDVLSSRGEAENRLQNLIGLYEVKESIKKIKAYMLCNKEDEQLNLHMCFYGNPGTGKTEVARIIADILYENNILPTNNLVEVERADLIGEYVGETPQKTAF